MLEFDHHYSDLSVIPLKVVSSGYHNLVSGEKEEKNREKRDGQRRDRRTEIRKWNTGRAYTHPQKASCPGPPRPATLLFPSHNEGKMKKSYKIYNRNINFNNNKKTTYSISLGTLSEVYWSLSHLPDHREGMRETGFLSHRDIKMCILPVHEPAEKHQRSLPLPILPEEDGSKGLLYSFNIKGTVGSICRFP